MDIIDKCFVFATFRTERRRRETSAIEDESGKETAIGTDREARWIAAVAVAINGELTPTVCSSRSSQLYQSQE